MVLRLCIQLRDEVGPAGRALFGRARLICPARGAARGVDQHHGKAMTAKCVSQRAGALYDILDGMNHWEADDALL